MGSASTLPTATKQPSSVALEKAIDERVTDKHARVTERYRKQVEVRFLGVKGRCVVVGVAAAGGLRFGGWPWPWHGRGCGRRQRRRAVAISPSPPLLQRSPPTPNSQAMDFDELVESAREIGLDPDSVAVAVADDSRAALEAGVLEALLERARVTDGKHRSQPRELGGMARDGSRFDSW